MPTENDVAQLENENRELKQLLSEALKASSILNDVVERYEKIVNTKDTKIFEDDENVKKLLEKYSRL